MSTKQPGFPRLSSLVLIVGLAAVATIIALFFSSYSPGSPRSVNSTEQAKGLADQYVTGNADLKVEEIMEFQNNFYMLIQEKSTELMPISF